MAFAMQAVFGDLPKDDRRLTPEWRAWGVTEGDGSRPRGFPGQICPVVDYVLEQFAGTASSVRRKLGLAVRPHFMLCARFAACVTGVVVCRLREK
eukprot:1947549-Lingulodinium_polyedra.AAC.1